MREKKTKIKNTIFIIILALTSLVFIILPKNYFSKAERRQLAKRPELSWEEIRSGNFIDDWEVYFQDHFPFRDSMRYQRFKFDLNILNKKDSQDYFIKNNYMSKIQYDFKAKSFEKSADYDLDMANKLFPNNKVHYAIIPNKNYYLIDKDYYKLDYDYYENIYDERVRGDMAKVDLRNRLTLDSYYKTDIHWRQEKIVGLARDIMTNMGCHLRLNDYGIKSYGKFRGSYGSSLNNKKIEDDLIVVLGPTIASGRARNLLNDEEMDIYVAKESISPDPYNIYLKGPMELIEIRKNSFTEAKGKTLYLIRDSFGSSLAPLLLEGYDRIILIDPRYMSKKLVGNYIEPKIDDDVLFLHSIDMLNNYSLFK